MPSSAAAFCPFAADCAYGGTCGLRITPELKAEATRRGVRIAQYTSPPAFCYKTTDQAKSTRED